MFKRISLQLKSSYLIFYLATGLSVASFACFVFSAVSILDLLSFASFLSFTPHSFSHLLVVLCLLILIGLFLLRLLIRQIFYLKNNFIYKGLFQCDESGWQLNQKPITELVLLHRSRLGLLIQFRYVNGRDGENLSNGTKSPKFLFWVSNAVTGEGNTRQFSRCFSR